MTAMDTIDKSIAVCNKWIMADKLMLRVKETAESLGVSRAKAYELIAAGEIPSVRLGGSVRVPVEALRTWVDSQTKKPKPS